MPAVPADKLDFSAAPVVLTVSAPPQMAEILAIISAPGTRAGRRVLPCGSGAGAACGLILNLMPCVLPVLALKLSAVIGVVGASRQERGCVSCRANGILASSLLAGGLFVRPAGGTVGWGIQFQNPAFPMAMMVMLGIFALSLLDLEHPRSAFRTAACRHIRTFRPARLFWRFSRWHAGHNPGNAMFGALVGTAVAVALSGAWPTRSDFHGAGAGRRPRCWWRHSSLVGFLRVQVPGCPG